MDRRRWWTPVRSAAVRSVASFALLTSAVAAPAAEPVAVDFAGTSVDGKPFRLSDYRGRWLLVNYWATWCPSCLEELPMLSRLSDREPRLAIVGLTDEKIENGALRSFLSAHPVRYLIAQVDRETLPAGLRPTAYGFPVRPISYLVGPDGQIVERFIGSVDEGKLLHRVHATPP